MRLVYLSTPNLLEMELRRAILLFAIVLGLAAVATSLSRPAPRNEESRGDQGASSRPTANPGPGSVAVTTKPRAPIVFETGAGTPETQSVRAGEAATVRIETDEAGEVSVEGLGLLAYAEPGAPARLEVLSTVPDRHKIGFRPTADGQARTLGFLQVTP